MLQATGFRPYRVNDLGSKVLVLGLKRSGFKVQGLGFRVKGLVFRA
jgi:hypothetical protein